MLESTPEAPYGGQFSDLLCVERSMRLRRARLHSVLAPGEVAPTMTCLPTIGAGNDFVRPPGTPRGPILNSDILTDSTISQHPRYRAIILAMRERRGCNTSVSVPIFRDVRTPEFGLRRSGSACSMTDSDGSSDFSAPSSSTDSNSNSDSMATSCTSCTRSCKCGHDRQQPLPQPPAAEPANSSSTCPGCPSGSCCSSHSTPCAAAVHLDNTVFGAGCCCLQVTVQARDEDESRLLCDQFTILAPIMLALSAATPAIRGRLLDTDTRWEFIVGGLDDRTPGERGIACPAAAAATASWAGVWQQQRQPKSRFSSTSTYLHRRGHADPRLCDVPCPIDASAYARLLAAGVDPPVAQHVAHMLSRDPLVVLGGCACTQSGSGRCGGDGDDVGAGGGDNSNSGESSSGDSGDGCGSGGAATSSSAESGGGTGGDTACGWEHDECIQSTTWPTARWKVPPPVPQQHTGNSAPQTGWRAEFRSMEVQLTDAENAAYVVFVVLLSHALLAFDVDLYMPLSMVDDNVRRASLRGVVLRHRFFWRHHILPGGNAASGSALEEMTMEEIMLGKGPNNPGLIPLVEAYLEHAGMSTCGRLGEYLALLRARASGALPTAAAWMRSVITSHPAYAHDSVVTPAIAADLVRTCDLIGSGRRACPELLGALHVAPVDVKLAEAEWEEFSQAASGCSASLVGSQGVCSRGKVEPAGLRALLAKHTARTCGGMHATTTGNMLAVDDTLKHLPHKYSMGLEFALYD